MRRNVNRVDIENVENELTLAIGGVDTEEDEPREVLKLISSADLSISIISLGLGHGCVMYGDNALTYKHVPNKAHGARAFGLQSVAAFIGFGVFSFLASMILDVFGRRLPS